MQQRKQVISIIGTIGFGVFLALLMLEIIGRVLHLMPVALPESYQEVRQYVGRFPEPYQYFWFDREDGERIWVQFNFGSLRDIDHPYATPQDTTRIMFIGDSFTAGWQVPLDQTYTGNLRQWLGRDYEVINAGLHGWGTDRQFLYYNHEGYRYNSDFVILQIYVGNDIIDNGIAVLQQRPVADMSREVAPEPITEDRPYFTLDEDGTVIYTAPRSLIATREESVGGIRSFLRYYSFTYGLFTGLLQSTDTPSLNAEVPRWVVRGNVIPMDYYAFSPQSHNDSDWQEAWTITTYLVRQLREKVEAHDGKLLVLLVAPRWQHDSTGFEVIRADWGIPEYWDSGQWMQPMRDFLDEEAIPYLEPLPALIRYQEATGEAIILTKDGHWTADGQCVVAAELHNWFIAQSILPSSSATLDAVSYCKQ